MTLWDKILATPQSLVGENISEDSLCFPINYQVSLTYSFVVKILSQQVCQFLTYAYAEFFPLIHSIILLTLMIFHCTHTEIS